MQTLHLEKDTSPLVGIDLGTSTCAIAALIEGRPILLADASGDTIIPSVVQLNAQDEFVVGQAAKAGAVAFHDRTVQEVKRLMGTADAVKLGEKAMTPEGVAAVLLRHLKAAGEAQLDHAIKDVVLSVPARFENEAREATRRAAQMAGLNVLRLINEPTAAALSYGLDRLDEQQKVLVFDFGGGTLDVTVLELFEGVLDVKTSVGDDKLGGKDVDEIVVSLLRDVYKEQKGKKLAAPSRDKKAAQMLKEEAERVKIALSLADTVFVDLPLLTSDGGLQTNLTRDALDEKLEPLLLRAMALVNEALSRARVEWGEIDVVLPVGGSSRIPLFRRALEYAWGRPLSDWDNPEEAVARGAAIAAGIEKKVFLEAAEASAQGGSEKDLMVLDVSPHRLGVAAIKQIGAGQFIDDYFSEIIPKDAKLPFIERRTYATQFKESKPITISIYEATSDGSLCRDHRLVSELPLRPLSGSENEPVQVEFRYTLDGTLDVSIRYLSAPAVRSEGRFVMAGGSGGTNDGEIDPSPLPETVPPEAIETAWRKAPQAELCGPLLEQAERLIRDQKAAAAAQGLPEAAFAVKRAVVQNDEVEIRKHLDALTDVLFEMA